MVKYYFGLLIVLIVSCKGPENNKTVHGASLGSFFDFFSAEEKAAPIDSLYVASFEEENLKSFYRKFSFNTVWDDKLLRDEALLELEKAGSEGLNPEEYNLEYLKNFENRFDSLPDTEKIDYDVQLTRNVLKYIIHINKGRVDPYSLYDDWDLGKKELDESRVLEMCITEKKFKTIIDDKKPKFPLYQQLKEALAKLKNTEDKYTETIDLTEKFSFNTASKSMPLVKRKLILWGDLKRKDTLLTKVYDKETQAAVKRFQKRHGLAADGVIGKGTLEALNFSRNQRMEQIIVNMERLRWMPDDPGSHYILVNIPDFHMTVYKDKDSVFGKRVVVGKPDRKTPVLASKVTNIVLNPNWTVPPTILKEDVFPAAAKSRSTFARKGLHILDSKNREVSASKWRPEDAKRYRYVQNPSGNNALGYLKVNFNNKYAVYLHDTNHRNYFKYDYRALSSGCVRVEKPLELGEYILNDTANWSLPKIENYTVKSKKLVTKTIEIKDDIRVYLIYNTGWFERNQLQFREDIYCMDADLYSKLQYGL